MSIFSIFDKPNGLLARYEAGCGYGRGDVLRPRKGCSPCWAEYAPITVRRKLSLGNAQYECIAEDKTRDDPSRRLMCIEVNGHEWEIAE